MEFKEDPFDSVIEEVAALLATGYLRLLKARTRNEPSVPAARQATGERLDGAPCPRPHGAMSATPNEKGDSP